MKRIKLYKGFIPQSYNQNKESLKNKGNRRSIIFLIIINLGLLPVNINAISNIKSNSSNSSVVKDYDNENLNKDKIIESLELFNYNIESIQGDEERTEVITKDKTLIYKLNNDSFNINRVDMDNDEIKITLKGE